jgi:hypothetical protein
MHGPPSWRMSSVGSLYVFSVPTLLYHFSQFFFGIAHMRRRLCCSTQRRKCHQIPVRCFFSMSGIALMSYMTHSVELGPNQVCTLFGAQPGSRIVTGKDYIKAGYNLDTDDLWRRNFVVLFSFLIFFWFTQTVVIELYPVSTS